MSRIAEIRERLEAEHGHALPMTPIRRQLLREDVHWLLTRLEEAEKVMERLSVWKAVGDSGYRIDFDDPQSEEIKDRIHLTRKWLEGEDDG